jgi:hypothetical protein
MVAIDTWQESGFGEVGKNYLARLAPPPSPSPASGGGKGGGIRREIDENGDLLVRRMGAAEPERRSLVEALATPSWLDPATGGLLV